MDDAVMEEQPLERPSRGHVLTPRRMGALLTVALLAFRLRRHFRYARNVYTYRRQLRLALALLLYLRQRRKN